MPALNQIAKLTVAFIGFGEAASAFVAGWADKRPGTIRAYDIKTEAEATRARKLSDYTTSGVTGCTTVAAAVAEADVVFSLVTADQALAAAQGAAGHLREGCLYLDGNSCAPGTKRRAASFVDKNSGRYVDLAIMRPVYPLLHETPVLVSGHAADRALRVLKTLSMCAELTEGGVGAASSIKMVRSIMVKGLEALVAECILAGHKAGVADIVLEGLEDSYPGFGWKDRAGYMLGRMMKHGVRRAAEMREVAKMVDQLGLDARMSAATADWQQKIGDLRLSMGEDSYQLRAAAILDALADDTHKKPDGE